jgi:hypothetical protein
MKKQAATISKSHCKHGIHLLHRINFMMDAN